jgi:hypothetical protein
MLINVANLEDSHSTCALNLACALSGTDHLCADRWKDARRVILFDPEPSSAGGQLPVSRDYLPLEDSTIDEWLLRILSMRSRAAISTSFSRSKHLVPRETVRAIRIISLAHTPVGV